MRTFIQLLTPFVLLFFAIPVQAQNAMVSPTAAKTDTRTPKTPLFIHKAASAGELSARLEAFSQSTSADFTWGKFDEVTGLYATINTESGVSSSAITGQGEGGYRVIRDNDGTNLSDTLYGWVIMDYLKIDNIVPDNKCDALNLAVYHTVQILYYYYDLSETPAQRFILNTNPKVVLRSTPNDIYAGSPDMPDSWKNTSIRSQAMTTVQISNPAPLVSATYTAYIKDDFIESSEASTAQIPAIAVYAVMKAEEQQADGNWVETKTLQGSALYKLRFDHSESKNANTYTWIGYDNYNTVQTRDRMLWTYTTNNAADKAYVRYNYLGEELDGYLPGQYRDSLIVLNSVTGCKDAIDLQFILGANNPFVVVEASKFDPMSLPNVFTPNGDGVNDVFKFVTGNEPVSMKTITLRIFDRAGKELYYYNGRVSDWQGWNGKIKGTGADCTVGVYYYEISGTGWDNESYSGKPYRGFVHLFKE